MAYARTARARSRPTCTGVSESGGVARNGWSTWLGLGVGIRIGASPKPKPKPKPEPKPKPKPKPKANHNPNPNPNPNPRVGGSTGSKAEMLRKTVACTASAASTCLGWG